MGKGRLAGNFGTQESHQTNPATLHSANAREWDAKAKGQDRKYQPRSRITDFAPVRGGILCVQASRTEWESGCSLGGNPLRFPRQMLPFRGDRKESGACKIRTNRNTT